VISTVVFALVIFKFDWVTATIAGAFIFIILMLKSVGWYRYFIYDISINSSEVMLDYSDKAGRKTIKDAPGFFKFKKRSTFGKTPDFYLAVYYKGNLLLKQYENGTWDKSKFDEVIQTASALTAKHS